MKPLLAVQPGDGSQAEILATREKKWLLREPSCRPVRRQQLRKFLSGSARARIVPAELLGQLLRFVDDADAFADMPLGRETLPAFAGDLERGLIVHGMVLVFHRAAIVVG